jgi:hypothetical protein
VLCPSHWVLIQDLGFLGGLRADPNSMIPFVLLAAGSLSGPDPGGLAPGR